MKKQQALLIITLFLANLIPSFTQADNVEKTHTIQFFAHRGSRMEFDENTMEAFRATYDAGIRGYETDIRMTADGDLILSHDESLMRTCGIDIQTEDLTNNQCRKIRTLQGNKLVFAKELAKYLKDKDNMYVEWEIKTISSLYDEAKLEVLCKKLWKTVMPTKPEHSEYLFTSFDKRALRIMKKLHPEAILMMLESKPCTKEIVDEALSMGIDRVGCIMDGTTRDVVHYAHDKGVIVSLWPGNCVADFLLGYAIGCDAMCCDRALEVGDWVLSNLPEVNLKGYEPAPDAPKHEGTHSSYTGECPETVQFIGHRGGRFETDENTLSAFQVSYASGTRGYETDVHLSSDGELVISHDSNLKRIFGVDLEVESSTAEQIRAVRNGFQHPVCFASDLVDFLADKPGIYIEWEIKTNEKLYDEARLEELCQKLYDLTNAHRPANATIIYSSFDVRVLKVMRRLHPDADIMLITGKPYCDDVRKTMEELGTHRAACNINGTRRADVREAHKNGLFLNLWPIRNEEDFRLAVAVGADVFCLDAPFAAREYQQKSFPLLKYK